MAESKRRQARRQSRGARFPSGGALTEPLTTGPGRPVSGQTPRLHPLSPLAYNPSPRLVFQRPDEVVFGTLGCDNGLPAAPAINTVAERRRTQYVTEGSDPNARERRISFVACESLLRMQDRGG